MAVKAVITHSSEGLVKIMEELKKKAGGSSVVIETINISLSEWLVAARLEPDEVVALMFEENPGNPHKLFTTNMLRLKNIPKWIDDGCWVVKIHRPGREETIARQILADYTRNFPGHTGWAPWGPLPKGLTDFSPITKSRKRIEMGKTIDRALEKSGLVYGSLRGTWMPGLHFFEVTQHQFEVISKLVKAAFVFKKALSLLYRENEWAQSILNIGRPSFACQWALRGEPSFPLKIRLDIAISKEGEPFITEIDGTPAGEGIHTGLRAIYQNIFGADGRYAPKDVVEGYAAMAKAMLPKGNIMFLITDDAKPFFPEQQVKAHRLKERGVSVIVCGPDEVEIIKGRVFAKGEPVSAWDRFVETYELNDPKLRQLAELSERGSLLAFPAFRNFYWEGKETLALLHHPDLKTFWSKEMGDEFAFIKKHTPVTLFPDSPQVASEPKDDWYRKRASQGDNQCWGSRGVVAGSKETQGDWERQLSRDRMDFAERTFPYNVYQQAVAHFSHDVIAYDRETETVVRKGLFVRLTPWGYYDGQTIHVCDMVATLRNDLRVHGAKDSVQMPCVIV